MTKDRTGAWVAVLSIVLGGSAVAIVGCDAGNSGKRPPAASIGGESKATKPQGQGESPVGKLMADWPSEKFAGALVLSGEMIGYHEPCGCTADQKGGLVRRSILIDLLRKQGWNLALLDLGSLIQDPAKGRDGPDQTREKLSMTIKALELMGYSALALSADDLRLGAGDTLMQFGNVIEEGETRLKVVSANAAPEPALELQKKIRQSLRLNVGPVKVGVTSVLDPAGFDALKDDTKTEILKVSPPEEALPSVLADLERDTNVQVLLVQGPPELAKRLASEFPGFELVVSTSETPDPPAKPEVLNDGKTWLVTAGRKGMYVSVIGLYLDPKQKFRYQRVELNKRYDQYRKDVPEMIKLVGDDFQQTLKQVGVLQSYRRLPYTLFNTPPNAAFVGAESCKDCHSKTYAHWASTKHAHAYDAIVSDPRDSGRNREYDAACVSCHTVGFQFVGGFVTADQSSELKGVQCESCHGPASLHVEDPKNEIALQAIKRTADDFRHNDRCIQCHDEDNDPHYDWEKYWPQIMHNGLDKKKAD